MAEQTVNWNRPLAGGAKNYLDDIRALNAKVPEEMERGVREGYLETDRIAGLAERLGVRLPRIKTRRYVYVETRQIQSYAVDAYDEADALQQAEAALGVSLRRGEPLYGLRRSRWAGDENRSLMYSELTTTRPPMDHNLRFHLNRRDEPVALRSETGTVIHENAEAVTRPSQTEGLPMPDLGVAAAAFDGTTRSNQVSIAFDGLVRDTQERAQIHVDGINNFQFDTTAIRATDETF